MFQTVWWNTIVFQAVPDVPGYSRTYRKVAYVYFFLADVEEALVHGIACRALFFFASWQDAFSALPIYVLELKNLLAFYYRRSWTLCSPTTGTTSMIIRVKTEET